MALFPVYMSLYIRIAPAELISLNGPVVNVEFRPDWKVTPDPVPMVDRVQPDEPGVAPSVITLAASATAVDVNVTLLPAVSLSVPPLSDKALAPMLMPLASLWPDKMV